MTPPDRCGSPSSGSRARGTNSAELRGGATHGDDLSTDKGGIVTFAMTHHDALRQLGDRLIERTDVVGSGAGAGVAGSQHAGERLTGGGEPEGRVETEAMQE